MALDNSQLPQDLGELEQVQVAQVCMSHHYFTSFLAIAYFDDLLQPMFIFQDFHSGSPRQAQHQLGLVLAQELAPQEQVTFKCLLHWCGLLPVS